MHFSSLFISSALLASAVLAGRLGELRRSPTDLVNKRADNSDTAGAFLTQGTFNYVSAILVVPEIAPGLTSHGDAVVVIDRESNCSASFAVGLGFQLLPNNNTVYTVWAQWSPDHQQGFDDSITSISAGDEVKLTVMLDTYTSTTLGEAIVENMTKKQYSSIHFQSSHPLCLKTAGWAVLANADGVQPLARFGTITFANATAIGKAGERYRPPSSTLYEISQDNHDLTSVQTGYDSVTVEYRHIE